MQELILENIKIYGNTKISGNKEITTEI